MKAYFFTMTQLNFRSVPIGKITGIVSADNEDEAIAKAWELAGNDSAYGVEVSEIDVNAGYKFTVYKSAI